MAAPFYFEHLQSFQAVDAFNGYLIIETRNVQMLKFDKLFTNFMRVSGILFHTR